MNTGWVDEVQKGKDVDTGHYLELDSGGFASGVVLWREGEAWVLGRDVPCSRGASLESRSECPEMDIGF